MKNNVKIILNSSKNLQIYEFSLLFFIRLSVAIVIKKPTLEKNLIKKANLAVFWLILIWSNISDKSSTSRTSIDVSTDVAQKKFGNAKAISSDQFFNDREADYETKANLNRFQGSSSISSAEFFGNGKGMYLQQNYFVFLL